MQFCCLNWHFIPCAAIEFATAPDAVYFFVAAVLFVKKWNVIRKTIIADLTEPVEIGGAIVLAEAAFAAGDNPSELIICNIEGIKSFPKI